MKFPVTSFNQKLAAAVSLGLVGIVSAGAFGDGSVTSEVEAVKNLVSAMQDRSPGARTEGALTTSKKRAALVEAPSARALPKVRERVKPNNPAAAPKVADGITIIDNPAVAEVLNPAAPIQLAGLVPGSILPPGFGGALVPGVPGGGGGGGSLPGGGGGGGGIIPPGVIGPPGGGIPPDVAPPPTLIPPDVIVPPGGGVPPDVAPPPTIVPPTSPVPEPGTWMMMLFGFGAIGVAVRRKRLKSASSLALVVDGND